MSIFSAISWREQNTLDDDLNLINKSVLIIHNLTTKGIEGIIQYKYLW